MRQAEGKDKGQLLAASAQQVRQHGLSEDDADDVLQQARIRYFLRRHVDYLDDAEPQPALMNTIITGVIVDSQRQRARRLRAEQQFAATHTPCFDESALHDQLLVKELLARLPARWRMVADWLLEGLSWREIARRLNRPVGTVSVQFRRALEKVCKELGIVCRKSGLSSGIKDGSVQRRRGTSRRRRSEAKAEGVADECADVDDSEPGDAAKHPRCHRRTQRRGQDGSSS